MKVKVRSGYDDHELEKEINNTIAKAEENDHYLESIEYSVAYDENKRQILRSAVLIFEEYSEDEEDYE